MPDCSQMTVSFRPPSGVAETADDDAGNGAELASLTLAAQQPVPLVKRYITARGARPSVEQPAIERVSCPNEVYGKGLNMRQSDLETPTRCLEQSHYLMQLVEPESSLDSSLSDESRHKRSLQDLFAADGDGGSVESYDWDEEFTKQSTIKVAGMLEEIENCMFSGKTNMDIDQPLLASNCAEWQGSFDHFWIKGKQVVKPQEREPYVSVKTQKRAIGVADTGHNDADTEKDGLCIQGSNRVPSTDDFSQFGEDEGEILAADGDDAEYFAVDSSGSFGEERGSPSDEGSKGATLNSSRGRQGVGAGEKSDAAFEALFSGAPEDKKAVKPCKGEGKGRSTAVSPRACHREEVVCAVFQNVWARVAPMLVNHMKAMASSDEADRRTESARMEQEEIEPGNYYVEHDYADPARLNHWGTHGDHMGMNECQNMEAYPQQDRLHQKQKGSGKNGNGRRTIDVGGNAHVGMDRGDRGNESLYRDERLHPGCFADMRFGPVHFETVAPQSSLVTCSPKQAAMQEQGFGYAPKTVYAAGFRRSWNANRQQTKGKAPGGRQTFLFKDAEPASRASLHPPRTAPSARHWAGPQGGGAQYPPEAPLSARSRNNQLSLDMTQSQVYQNSSVTYWSALPARGSRHQKKLPSLPNGGLQGRQGRSSLNRSQNSRRRSSSNGML